MVPGGRIAIVGTAGCKAACAALSVTRSGPEPTGGRGDAATARYRHDARDLVASRQAGQRVCRGDAVGAEGEADKRAGSGKGPGPRHGRAG
jgi:hypothetical protein